MVDTKSFSIITQQRFDSIEFKVKKDEKNIARMQSTSADLCLKQKGEMHLQYKVEQKNRLRIKVKVG